MTGGVLFWGAYQWLDLGGQIMESISIRAFWIRCVCVFFFLNSFDYTVVTRDVHVSSILLDDVVMCFRCSVLDGYHQAVGLLPRVKHISTAVDYFEA